MNGGYPDPIRTAMNDALRRAMGLGIHAIGHVMHRDMERRIANYAADQRELKRRYGVRDETPIRVYDDEVRRTVEAYAARRPDAQFAFTSGSTAQPKKIAFTPQRLAEIKRGSLSVVSRLMLHRGIAGTSLFILSGLKEDDSLSSLLLSSRGDRTPYLTRLLMPARYLVEPGLRELVPEYGATAARLFLIVLSNPAILYGTNPSTLALFLTDVHSSWGVASRLVREFVEDPARFDPAVRRVARDVASAGWRERFEEVARAKSALPVHVYAPGLDVYCCWDGGYVRPFLDQIRAFLPADRYTHLPMYSMSTETVETLNYYDGDEVRFLAIAARVFYEFLPEGSDDDPSRLVPAYELVPGRAYTMVVSDPYGLTRYQTEDIFHCAARVGDVPDLRFLRRRGLAYSFTGEKLTDVHMVQAFAALRASFPAIPAAGMQLTCIPSRPAKALVPSYRLVLARPGPAASVDLAAVAATLDRELALINTEYAAKRESKRLAAPTAVMMTYDELAARLDPKSAPGDEAHRGWDMQFKLLPLVTRLWEEYGFD